MISEPEARLIKLFSAVVVADWEQVAEIRRSAAPGEVDQRWREALLQAHLFCGIPRTIEAFEVVERAGGLSPVSDATHDARPGDGLELFNRIYAGVASEVRGHLESLDSDLATWIAEHAYQRVLARSGLTPRMRELLAVAALSVTGQTRQLASHVRGAIRCGATSDELVSVGDMTTVRASAADRARIAEIISRFAAPASK